jgi:5-methylcytosine-specific restriction endonuclease McrA
MEQGSCSLMALLPKVLVGYAGLTRPSTGHVDGFVRQKDIVMRRDSEKEFSAQIKLHALARQDFLCASCASLIAPFTARKLMSAAWGESAHAHHRKPVKSGGGGNVENCVILCESCHYSAHEGGNYKSGKVWGRIRNFPFFYGARGRPAP